MAGLLFGWTVDAFNSLSRDHSLVLKRAENEPVTSLSTPSLGITGRISSPDVTLIWGAIGSFQLPLSGSPMRGSEVLEELLHGLSTPSLGITQKSASSNAVFTGTLFQLPLSGSQAEEARKDPSPGDLPLSTPSLGITFILGS